MSSLPWVPATATAESAAVCQDVAGLLSSSRTCGNMPRMQVARARRPAGQAPPPAAAHPPLTRHQTQAKIQALPEDRAECGRTDADRRPQSLALIMRVASDMQRRAAGPHQNGHHGLRRNVATAAASVSAAMPCAAGVHVRAVHQAEGSRNLGCAGQQCAAAGASYRQTMAVIAKYASCIQVSFRGSGIRQIGRLGDILHSAVIAANMPSLMHSASHPGWLSWAA